MLDGLEQVDWARLVHAYGPAETTPVRMRALLSEDPQVRERTLGVLWNTLFHQGTIYDATLHAVPFLLELLALPSFKEKEGVLRLLAACVEGCFPDRFVVEAGCLLSEWDTPTPEARRELVWRQAIVGQTQAAVRAGQAVYARLLADTDADVAVRQVALTLLTTPTVAQDRAWLAIVLGRQLAAESDRGMRVALARFLGECQPLDVASQALLITCWRHDADPLVRLAAAVALATGLRTDAPSAVVQDVADALVEFETDSVRRYNDGMYYMDAIGHRRGAGVDFTLDLTLALRALGEHGQALALPRLTRALATHCAGLAEQRERALPTEFMGVTMKPYLADDGTKQWRRVEGRSIFPLTAELQLAKALLTLTFGEPQEDEDGLRRADCSTDLSHEQQIALASLLDCEVVWRYDAIMDRLLSERSLPYTREALRNYLAQARRE